MIFNFDGSGKRFPALVDFYKGEWAGAGRTAEPTSPSRSPRGWFAATAGWAA